MDREQAVDAAKREIHRRAELIGFFVKDDDLGVFEEGGSLWVLARTVYYKNRFVYKLRCDNGHEFLREAIDLDTSLVFAFRGETNCPVCGTRVAAWFSDKHPFSLGLFDIMGTPYPRENKSDMVIYAEVYENDVFGRINEAGEYRLYYKPLTIRIPIPALVFKLPPQPPYESIERYAADCSVFHKE